MSTDLSHYHGVETARRLDRATADAIIAREPENLSGEDACGYYPLRGLLELARRRKSLPIRLLDLRTSGDTAGDPVERGRLRGGRSRKWERREEKKKKKKKKEFGIS